MANFCYPKCQNVKSPSEICDIFLWLNSTLSHFFLLLFLYTILLAFAICYSPTNLSLVMSQRISASSNLPNLIILHLRILNDISCLLPQFTINSYSSIFDQIVSSYIQLLQIWCNLHPTNKMIAEMLKTVIIIDQYLVDIQYIGFKVYNPLERCDSMEYSSAQENKKG